MDQTSKEFCRCFEEVIRNYGFNGNLGKDFDSQAFQKWVDGRISILESQIKLYGTFTTLAESYKSINNS